jgi:hypothetical protein
MGHGLGETVAAQVEPRVFVEFGQHVGWRGGRLYDQGVEDEAHRITRENWNSSSWQDQPLSLHSLANVGEDFAETVAAFATQAQALRARSPLRHEYMQNNLDSFRPVVRVAAPRARSRRVRLPPAPPTTIETSHRDVTPARPELEIAIRCP